MSSKIINRCLAVLVVGGLAVPAQALTLDEYLNQVKGESLGYRSFEESAKAATLKARDADLFFTPKLFANAQLLKDGKEPFSAIMYDRINMENYSLGLSQEFSFGLKATVSYAAEKTEIEGIQSASIPAGFPTTFWYATPKLELSMPLWGNAFGKTERAKQELNRQQSVAERFGSEAQAKGYLTEAEAAFWRLASAQDIVAVQKRALAQAQSILDYVTKKEKMNLGEKADVLQAKAMVEAVSFQVQLAANQEKAARRQFNTYINRQAEEPAPALSGIDYGTLTTVELPKSRPGDRYDLQVAQAQADLAKASANVLAEKNRPTLDVYGSYALNGRSTDLQEAMDRTNMTEHDTTVVGVRLNIPLNIGAAADAKAGALKSAKAADLLYQHKKFTQEQDWENLVQQLGEAKENLRLATGIVNAQKAKLDNERARLKQGRTTTYQVLLFEQDFSQSEVNRVQAAAQILGLQAQIKLYETNAEGGK